MTSGKKIALIAVPVVAVAVAIAAVFALPSTGDSTDVQGCDAIERRVNTILVTLGGSTDETRNATNVLVDEYCKRTQLVEEIGAMKNPAIGLVAYGCDAGSGRLGDGGLQQSLRPYATIYCDNAFVAIFEQSESLLTEADDFRDYILGRLEGGQGDPEGNGSNNATSTVNLEEVEAKFQEISALANQAKSLLRSDKYYDAAKAYDSATKLLDELASTDIG